MAHEVLVTSANWSCGHGGTLLPTSLNSTHKLTVTVGGVARAVLTTDNVTQATLSPGCSQVNTNAGETPCSKVVSVAGTLSGKLTVGGTTVVVADLSGMTDGVPKKTDLSGSAGQAKLTAL